jgi:hypothetical protein
MGVDLVVGSIIGSRYRLERLLGEGSMGRVWAATQTITGKPVALKFLKGKPNELVRRRFLNEARVACAVRHPNVVEIYDVIELGDGSHVMVMELLEGESLELRLAREQRLALPELSRILLPVVSAVGTAHTFGIVHRDLKPDNIFLALAGDGTLRTKVLDFGIAKLVGTGGEAAQTAGLTATGALMGTPYYMSPEQAGGENDLDHRSDIWALGVILYRGLSGTLPTQADSLRAVLKRVMLGPLTPIESVAPHLPEEVTALVGRMLSIRREDRPTDLREVKDVLERYVGASTASFGAARAIVPELCAESSDAARHQEVGTPAHAGMQTHGAVSMGVNGTRRASRVAVGALAGAVAVAGGLFGLLRTPGAPQMAAAGVANPSTHAVEARAAEPASMIPTPPVVTATAPTVELSASVSAAPLVPPVEKPRTASPSISKKPPLPIDIPKTTAGGCDPAYTVDVTGHRTIKPECNQ